MSTKPDFDSILSAVDSIDELREAFADLARTLQDRNDTPISIDFTKDDPRVEALLGTLETHIGVLLGMDDSDYMKTSAIQEQQHVLADLLNEDANTPLSTLIRQLAHWITGSYFDGIDRYVETLDDFRLVRELNLDVDAEGLTDLNNPRLELLPQGIRVDHDIRLYLHQFLRRYFSGNFVDLPKLLSKAMDDGQEVKVRVDPLRYGRMADYQEFLEEDHWYGPKFDLEFLNSTDKSEARTVHVTDEASITAKLLGMSYPVSQTHFRTSMLGEGLRQCSIEEYVPFTKLFGHRSPGFGSMRHIQKFAHFVYDQKSQTFEHVDCAVRVHGIEEYRALLAQTEEGRDPGRRTGTRFKLFKVSGQLELSLVEQLLYEYFRYNLHLHEFFGNLNSEQAFDLIRKS